MPAVITLDLALIELEYLEADCLLLQEGAVDYPKRANLDTLLRKVSTAKLAVRLALNVLSEPNIENEIGRVA